MKPIRDDKNFWTGLNNFLDIDVYQPRECLHGYSFASVLAMEPKEFDTMMKLNVSSDQKTLLEDFLVLDESQNKEDLLKGIEYVFRDEILIRNKKDI